MGRLYRKSLRNPLYILGIILLGLIVILAVMMISYNNNLKNARERSLTLQEDFLALLPNNDIVQTEEASSDLGKSINQVIEDAIKEETTNNESIDVSTKNSVVSEPVKKELSFEYPVEGEIVKDFTRDSLVYSETLKEWTIHNGIDIKADRTTVVKAAEEGIISAIKNDPRYGLTVIIEHEDGFKTIYSNLLTSEFVKEEEKVEKGQSIGTVGNSAAFEIADEAHLHFEMILNNEYVDQKMYLR